MIRVFIVDDHVMFRQGLIHLLNSESDIEIVGAVNGAESIELIKKTDPDIVLLDISMPEMDGYQIAEHLEHIRGDIRIIFLTMLDSQIAFNTASCHENMFGYVFKDCTFTELSTAIRTVAAGQYHLPRSLECASSETTQGTLTRREREILKMTARGMTASTVARKLGISAKTVENHRANIMHKLLASNMSAAIVAGVKSGIL